MNTALWIVYGVGVVLFPIVVGMLFKKKRFDVMDDGLPMFFLSFMWPVLVAASAVIGAVGMVCCALGFLWTFLLEFGSLVAMWLEGDKKKDSQSES